VAVTVEFSLAPTKRFTNKDITAALTLKAASGAGAGAGEPTLPVTGSRTPVLFGVGGALVLLGAGLLVLLRRRRVVIG
jgi:LPXTG-motif cell wall-anchored protein